jgi:hypothetical protein
VGGVAIHLVPDVNECDERGFWKGHCPFYYSSEFFELLATECGYEMLRNEVINGLRAVAVRKSRDIPFMSDRSNFLRAIAVREGGLSYGYLTIKGRLWVLARRLGIEGVLRGGARLISRG